MACAKCSFYLPKESTKAQLLEAKANLLRLRQDIPLADAELAAVEGGVGPMSGCLRHWLTCRRQGDLRRGNSRPNVWCNWNKCATEKGLVSNSGDRRDDDHAWRSSAIGFLLTHNAAPP